MHDQTLARANLEKRLAPIRQDSGLTRPPQGWVRAIREALGMTTTQLAQRLGISQSRASRLQQDEADDAITLHKLREVAAALECTLVYALVPKRPLDDMIASRAWLLAEESLKRVTHTMALEDQMLSIERQETERLRLMEALLKGPSKRLWDDP